VGSPVLEERTGNIDSSMFLKSLTLKGFKSFADATTLEFEPGVTVVVGPNGSGKSNVVDAVAWVLGAQGPRTVRSSKMEDVIFAGTPKRPALGRAEVSLTIDNSARRLPIEFSEVTITRTLFRTGESEYAINKVPCRLLDVQDLLSDTGVGRQQHVIISQGNIDAILSSRPEERRLVIEEAAGILKYRRRKERAERRLESTEASLVRLQDLLREVRRQLRPLQRQAEAARRHDDLLAELTSLRRHLAGVELVEIEARLEAAARTGSELAEAETGIRAALGGLDSEVEAAEAAVADSRARDDSVDLAEAVSRAEGARARAQGLAAVISERRRSLERELATQVDADVVSSLESEAAQLARALEATEAEAAQLLPHERDVTEAEEILAGETAEVERQWDGSAGPVTDPAAGVRAELGALRASLERDRTELRRLEGRDASLSQRQTRLTDEHGRLGRVVEEAEAATAALRAEVEESAAARVAADEAATDADEARRTAEGDHHRWLARTETLSQALDEARARAGAERLAEVEGVVGTLLELVEVDEGWEAAFEAAAGEVIPAVVVDGVEGARRSLDHLSSLGVTGAVVALPDAADSWRKVATGPEPGGLPAGAAALTRHVRARLPGVSALLADLLASAVVVEGGWAQALDLAASRPDLVVVTRAGDRCAGGVWRIGSGGTGATGAALDEARQRCEAAEVAVRTAAERARAARAHREAAQAAHADAQSRSEANLSRRRAAAEALARVGSELGDARHDAAALVEERSETTARLTRGEVRLAELEEALPALEKAAAAEAERALAERLARARLAERQAAVAALRRDFEVRVAGLEERRMLTSRRLADVEGRLQRNVHERAEAATRRQQLVTVASATARLGGLVAERQRRLDGLVGTLRNARRRETEASRARTDRLEHLRRQRAVAERQLSDLRERAGRVELDDADARLHLENLVEAVRRDLGEDLESARDAPCPELPAGTDARSRRAELEEELRRLGPINPLALEEHTALEERHQFLSDQLDDVQAARRELAKVVRAIDAEIVEVFRSAYLDVAENFSILFGTLFPGGEGRLRMTDPDQLLDTGIELDARPSGKNVRRLSLLSGGERSLTAMAFLFAVFRSRPSPFYLMDEVEAALDDVNLHRFLDLVHAFREDAQLVIVSHQKRTMEAADCLYGITMAPAGSSRVVSQKIGAAAS
jgi:chromosome segregation protein